MSILLLSIRKSSQHPLAQHDPKSPQRVIREHYTALITDTALQGPKVKDQPFLRPTDALRAIRRHIVYWRLIIAARDLSGKSRIHAQMMVRPVNAHRLTRPPAITDTATIL
jgi:hypothetical protein